MELGCDRLAPRDEGCEGCATLAYRGVAKRAARSPLRYDTSLKGGVWSFTKKGLRAVDDADPSYGRGAGARPGRDARVSESQAVRVLGLLRVARLRTLRRQSDKMRRPATENSAGVLRDVRRGRAEGGVGVEFGSWRAVACRGRGGETCRGRRARASAFAVATLRFARVASSRAVTASSTHRNSRL